MAPDYDNHKDHEDHVDHVKQADRSGGAILEAFNRVNTVTQRLSCSESFSVTTACDRKDIVSHSSITLSFRNSPCGLPAFIGSIAT